MPSPFFYLYDFAPQNTSLSLFTLNFDRCGKLVVPHPCFDRTSSILYPFTVATLLLVSMVKRNSAQSFFERARARGSENNQESINEEEVKRELQDGTKRNYSRALELWDQ